MLHAEALFGLRRHGTAWGVWFTMGEMNVLMNIHEQRLQRPCYVSVLMNRTSLKTYTEVINLRVYWIRWMWARSQCQILQIDTCSNALLFRACVCSDEICPWGIRNGCQWFLLQNRHFFIDYCVTVESDGSRPFRFVIHCLSWWRWCT